MKALGIVLGTNPKGQMIVRSKGPSNPRPGAPTYDSRKREIGRVKRIFGPVNAPFIGVKPREGVSVAELVGAEVFAED